MVLVFLKDKWVPKVATPAYISQIEKISQTKGKWRPNQRLNYSSSIKVNFSIQYLYLLRSQRHVQLEVVSAGKVIKHIGMLHPQQCKKALDKRKTIDEIGKWKNAEQASFQAYTFLLYIPDLLGDQRIGIFWRDLLQRYNHFQD